MLKTVFYRLVATLLAAAIAFYIGFVATEAAFDYWYVPGAVKEAPHDGQIGLSVFVGSAYCACACAIIVLAFGTLWTLRAARRSRIPRDRP